MSDEELRPTDATRAKLFAAIARAPSRTRAAQKRRLLFVWCGVGLFIVGASLAIRVKLGARSPTAVVLLLLVWMGTTLLAARAASPRQSMLGRPARDAAAVIGLALAGALLAVAGFSLLDPHPVGSGRAVPCLVTAMVFGLVPTAALVWSRAAAGGAPIGRAFVGASLGVVGALMGGVVALLHCPDGSLRHLVLGHAAVILVAAALGALALRRALDVRVRRSFDSDGS